MGGYSQSEKTEPLATNQDVDAQLKKQRQADREAHEKEISGLEKEITKLKSNLSKLEADSSAKIEANEIAANKKLIELSDERKALVEQIAGAKDLLDKLTAQFDELKSACDSARASIEKAKEGMDWQKREADLYLGEVKKNISALKEQEAELLEKIPVLKQNHDKLTLDTQALVGGLIKLNDTIEQKGKDKEALDAQNQSLETTMAGFQSEIDILAASKLNLTNEMNSMEIELEKSRKAVAENQALINSLKSWEEQLQRDKNQLKVDQSLNSKLRAELTERERKVAQLEAANAKP